MLSSFSQWFHTAPSLGTAFKNMFQIKSFNAPTYTFCAASPEEKMTWLTALNKAFTEMHPADKGKHAAIPMPIRSAPHLTMRRAVISQAEGAAGFGYDPS